MLAVYIIASIVTYIAIGSMVAALKDSHSEFDGYTFFVGLLWPLIATLYLFMFRPYKWMECILVTAKSKKQIPKATVRENK